MFFERPDAGRKALLVHMRQSGEDSTNELAELAELARSAELLPVARLDAVRRMPHPKFYFGSGKVDEVREEMAAHSLDLLLVNHDISPGQQRNLEAELDCRVVPRTELILHIFAQRALTHEGKLQVELAQLEHAQSRLVRGWTHLDRQKGGIGLRGAGEKQIEMDQRMLGERIKNVRAKLTSVGGRRAQGRRRRQRAQIPVVALVGYTNAGKSTLFNTLTEAQVMAEDRLFATLDPTMRQIEIAGIGPVVLADTVGFIRNLPHALVDAFKATLEEVAGADLLLHVIDASDETQLERREDVLTVLREIDADKLPTINVMNKCDLVEQPISARDGTAVSALTGVGLGDLLAQIGSALGVGEPREILLPASAGALRSRLYSCGAILEESIREDGSFALTVSARPEVLRSLDTKDQLLVGGFG